MQDSTREIIKAACGADLSISKEMLNAAIDILSGAVAMSVDRKESREDRILSRKEAAKILGMSPNRVDYYCRQKGGLRRVRLPGGSRSIGISALSVQDMISNH